MLHDAVVNDAERLRHDPAMRWIVGWKAAQGSAASPSQMARFETQWLAAPANLSALSDLSGQWIDLVHGRRPPRNDTASTYLQLCRTNQGAMKRLTRYETALWRQLTQILLLLERRAVARFRNFR
jgi:hypothetical protein